MRTYIKTIDQRKTIKIIFDAQMQLTAPYISGMDTYRTVHKVVGYIDERKYVECDAWSVLELMGKVEKVENQLAAAFNILSTDSRAFTTKLAQLAEWGYVDEATLHTKKLLEISRGTVDLDLIDKADDTDEINKLVDDQIGKPAEEKNL